MTGDITAVPAPQICRPSGQLTVSAEQHEWFGSYVDVTYDNGAKTMRVEAPGAIPTGKYSYIFPYLENITLVQINGNYNSGFTLLYGIYVNGKKVVDGQPLEYGRTSLTFASGTDMSPLSVGDELTGDGQYLGNWPSKLTGYRNGTTVSSPGSAFDGSPATYAQMSNSTSGMIWEPGFILRNGIEIRTNDNSIAYTLEYTLDDGTVKTTTATSDSSTSVQFYIRRRRQSY